MTLRLRSYSGSLVIVRTAFVLWIAARSAAPILAQSSVLTWHNDNARTGQNLEEMTLTPANVNVSMFGKLFVIPVDGKVDAQPLYVPSLPIPSRGSRNVLFVVTEHGSAYAFDADLGTMLWRVSLLGSGEATSDDRNCSQVTPEIGITSTPVIDPQSGPHGTMYAVAMSKDRSGAYHQRIHALDLTTGAEEFGGPVEIRAAYPGSGAEGSGATLTFDPKQHVERAALVIVNGVVYTSWSSHCDIGPYTSWVMGYDEATLARTSVLNLMPNGSEGGIWQAGAGPAADAAGDLYFLIGNGTVDPTLNASGFPVKGDYGNAFVRLSTGTGSLSVTDYFTMRNALSESNADQDLGSGGAMLLPALNDAQGNPRALAVGAGKDRNIYVVDRNGMGKFNPASNMIYQEMPAALGSVFSSPAWFNGVLYYGSVGTALKAFAFANGTFQPAPASQSSNAFPYPGATPSISADGSANGIVWAAENGTTAVLHAYDASNLAKELYNSNQAPSGRDHFGEGNKFIVPTVANGKVFVGTANGVGVFGLLAPAASGITINSVTNAASSAGGPIAPGEIVSIKGASLGPAAGVQFAVDPGSGTVAPLLAGTRVLFGGFAAPILYASSTQVNAIVPYEIAGQSQIVVQVEYQGVMSTGMTLQVASAAPGLFTLNFAGSGQAAALNQDGVVNGPSNPAAKGSYLSIYFSGGGETSPPGTTGSVTGLTLKYLTHNVSVTVGGQAATVTFAGAAPTLVDGVGQLNIRLAGNAQPGLAQPVVVTIDGIDSPATATLSIF